MSNENNEERIAFISSYKDAVPIVKDGTATGWGQVVIPVNNEAITGLGFSPVLSEFTKKDETLHPIKEVFHNGGFLNPVPQEVNVLSEENTEESLSDSEEEWKSYLKDSGYISQEEPYTPFCPPSKKFKGMFKTDNKIIAKEEIPPIPAEVWDTLGKPSGKFDFMVKYTAPESSKISIEDIQPTRWEII